MDDLNWVEGIDSWSQEDHYRAVRADPWSEYTDEEEGEEMEKLTLAHMGGMYLGHTAHRARTYGRACIGAGLDDAAMDRARAHAGDDLELKTGNDGMLWFEKKETLGPEPGAPGIPEDFNGRVLDMGCGMKLVL